MSRGVATFLTTRSKEEAWETVSRILREEEFVQRRAAKRLLLHERTLYLWLQKTGYDAEVRRMRAEAIAQKVQGA